MTTNRKFDDNAEFDQQQARAIELLKQSDSFVLFHFDSKRQRTEVVSAVAMSDVLHALTALESQAVILALRAVVKLQDFEQ